MKCMLTEVQPGLRKSMGMKRKTNPVVGGSLEMTPVERTLRRTSSDCGCITLNMSAIRLLHVILVGLWN